MSKLDFDDVMIIGGAIFIALFLYMVLVVNHQRNVERDKFLIQHCEKVSKDQEIWSEKYKCVEAKP